MSKRREREREKNRTKGSKGQIHSKLPWIKINKLIPRQKKKKKTVRQKKTHSNYIFWNSIIIKLNLEKCGETTAKR